MFRLIDKKTSIIYYNYTEHGYNILPTEKGYKIVKDNSQKDFKKDFILSVSTNTYDIVGRLLYTEDRIDFTYNDQKFHFGTIKYRNNNFMIETKNGFIPLTDAKQIYLSDYYNDPLSGHYS